MTPRVPDELLPPDEQRRVTAVHDLGLLDTPGERRFDSLVAELAGRLGVPIAYLALIAEDRQWLKSKVGPMPDESRREDAFCSRTILGDEPLLVADAAEDPRFADGKLVKDHPHLRFYAGIPISDAAGNNVGTVCVASPEPRKLEARDLAILRGFADRLEEEINTRPTVLLAYAQEDEALISRFIASHARLEDPAVLDLWSGQRGVQANGNAKLKDALWRSRAAVLMLSPAFLRSPFVHQPLFARLLRARELDGFSTTAVLLEPCDRAPVEWLADRAVWPPGGRAITLGSDPEIDRRFRDLACELVGARPEAPEGPAPEVSASRQPRLFLSHAGEDAAAVQELAGRLRRAGVAVWLDVDELQPGDDWMQSLEEALDGSDAFAVYVGRSGIARWIGREVRVALDRNAKDPRFRFIPILGPGADPDSLPRFVAQHHWLDLREGDPQPEEIRKLVASILSRPAEAVSLLPPGEPPFRGLLTFGAEHAHLFFGRDRETAELVERLRRSPFLALVGDSGSGKSSLVRAGLVPALHRGHFREEDSTAATWRVAVIKPGGEPFRALAGGLLDLLPEAGPAERIRTLEACSDLLAEGTRGLCSALAAIVPDGERTLLVIDQFEEVFSQCSDPDERDRFIDTVLEASRCEGERPLHTIVTLRADFYAHCFEHPTLPETLSTSQYAVRAIPPERLGQVIEKPAILAGLRLEPGLVEAILFDLGEGPGNLPLLEHTLLQLWKRRTGDTLTHASYEEIGRVQGALEHHAEEVYGRFDATEKRVARQILLGLVVPTELAAPARRRARLGEILPAGASREAAGTVLARLVDERLLVVRRSSGPGRLEEPEPPPPAGPEGAPSAAEDSEVEVTHEALLRGWRRLGGWLAEDREFLSWRQRVGAAFEAWRDSGRDSGALLRGAPLTEARHWLESRGEDLSEEGRAFIRASVDLSRRQRRIRQAVTAAIVLVAAVAVVFAVIARRAQREAESSLVTATTAVDEMLTRVGSEALADVPQLEGVRQELLTRARTLYQELVERRPSGARLQLQSALAPARIAEIDADMNDREAARRGFEAAIEKLESLARRAPDRPEYRFELAGVHGRLAWRLTEWSSAGDAEAASEAAHHYDRAIAIQKELLDARPADGGYAAALANNHVDRGILRSKHKETELAEADYRAAMGYVKPFSGRPGEAFDDARQKLARGHNQLANLRFRQRDWAEAAAEYGRAADLFRRLLEAHPQDREYKLELAKAYRNLATVQSRIDPAEADRSSLGAVTLMDELADPLAEIRSERADAYVTRGRALERSGRPREAAASYREALRIFDDLLGDYPEDRFPERSADRKSQAATLIYLGVLRQRGGDPDELAPILARLAEVMPLLLPEDRAQIEADARYRKLVAP